MERSSAPFFSSTRLNCRASSASSLAAWVTGTRSSMLPVLMMARAVRSISRTGLVARWAKTAPPTRPSSSVGPRAVMNAVRNGRQSVAPRSVLRPTWSTLPSLSSAEATT